MKKTLSLLLMLVMAVSFSACKNEEKKETSKNEKVTEEKTVEKTPEEETPAEDEVVKITNKDGTEFTADLTNEGVLSEMPVDAKTVQICGKTYEFPMKVSDLFNDGWDLGSLEFENEFKAKTKTTLFNFSIKDQEGHYLTLREVYNDTDSVQKLEDCWLTGIQIDCNLMPEKVPGFVLPGGITEESTAKNVISALGDPNNSEIFRGGSSGSKGLAYTEHKDSKMNFNYNFKDDGSISNIFIECEG